MPSDWQIELVAPVLIPVWSRRSLKGKTFPWPPIVVLILFLLAGCVSSQSLGGIEKVKRELESELNITRLPMGVKLEVDEKTKNWIIEKGPSTLRGSGNIVVLPLGDQFNVGAKKVVNLVFLKTDENTLRNDDAALKVGITDFKLEWELPFSLISQPVEYSMEMAVDTQLITKDGTVVYSKTLRRKITGMGPAPLEGLFVNIALPIGEGYADLVALWVRELVKDITENADVLQFAQAVAGSAQVAAVPRPEITIAQPVDASSTDHGEVQLVGSVQSPSPITDVVTSVNGRPLPPTRDLGVAPKNGHARALNRSIPLAFGENVISITATNQAGGTAQTVVRVLRVEPGLVTAVVHPGSPVGERWAVVVGISEYQHQAKGIPRVRHAVGDARAFAAFLQSPQGGGFPAEHVLLLTNEQATSAALRRALFTFLKQAIEEDLVLFFFSGQGAPEPGSPENYYLLTYEADPEDLPSTALATWDVNAAFHRNIKAKRAVIVVDASHVSAIGTETGRRGVGAHNLLTRYLKELAEAGEGKALFTATQEGQVAVEQSAKGRQTGLFTHYLLEALSGAADANEDGVVTLGEAVDYTTDVVVAASRGKQRPEITGTFDRSLPLAVLK